jgi:hypothetical protein
MKQRVANDLLIIKAFYEDEAYQRYIQPKPLPSTDFEHKKYLNKLLGDKQLVTKLLFRGSDHGFNRYSFLDRCVKKGPTISLFKILNGDCIGGYTTA